MEFKSEKIIVVYIIMFFLIGCCDTNIQKKLSNIDTLVSEEQFDKAYDEINRIDEKTLKDESDIAYYNLIMTQLLYKLYLPIESDSMINISIAYYEKEKDIENLARAYCYKGATICELGKVSDAVVCMKKAEYFAKELDDAVLDYKINQYMALFNGIANEYEESIKYSKKQYDASKKIGDSKQIVYALINMAITYTRMDMLDSAKIRITECLPFIKQIPSKEQAFFYTTIGSVYIDEEPELAKKYFMEALKRNALPQTYKYLADLYIKEGHREKAKDLWEKVLKYNDIELKIAALAALQGLQEENKEYEEALKTSQWILALKDSAQKKKEADKVMQLQERYDFQMKEMETESRNRNLILSIITLALLLFILTIYNQYVKIKNRRELDENRDKIAKYQERIQELEDNGEAASREAKSLHDKLGVLRDRQINLLNKGKSLYDHISRGGNLVHWDKVDMMYYIEYYRTVHPELIRSLEVDYDSLTPRQKILMTLYDMRKTESDMATIMAIGITSVRSMKTRIKQRKIVK